MLDKSIPYKDLIMTGSVCCRSVCLQDTVCVPGGKETRKTGPGSRRRPGSLGT